MHVVGLTGSVGMGKSTVLDFFRDEGVPVLSADSVVHDLYSGAAVGPVEEAFPGVAVDGTIDRTALSKALMSDPGGFATLEAIVHPLVRDAQRGFLVNCKRDGAEVVVIEVPLLFETGAEERYDAVVVVSAPSEIQRERVLARPGMTAEKFETILSRQTPDVEKRNRADYVIDTGVSLEETQEQVRMVLPLVRERAATAFAQFWCQ